MTKAEYIRWLDEKIAQSERWLDEAPEQREKMLHVGYRDAYVNAREQARRINSLETETELAYAHGDR